MTMSIKKAQKDKLKISLNSIKRMEINRTQPLYYYM